MSADTCPLCTADLRGDPVPEKYRTHKPNHGEQVARYGRCFCLPYGDISHFSRIIGIQVQGVYDGVLYWSCPDCGGAWTRNFGDYTRMNDASAQYVAKVNEEAA